MQIMRKFKQFFCIFAVLLFLSPALPVMSEEPAAPSLSEATAAVLYYLEEETVIVSKNADVQINAGSTAKIMAGLIACEVLEEHLSESVWITDEMLATAAGRIFDIPSGDRLSVEQLLYLALCGSYNDAYDVLACHISGSLSAFTDRMNRRADEIGLSSTRFTDASGIKDNAITTVHDLLKLAKTAYENELYMKITSTMRYSSPATLLMDAKKVSNRNALIYSQETTAYHNDKCLGMNAGYTSSAGSCVVTAATNGSETYLCVVMGAMQTNTADFGYVLVNRLINWVYKTYAKTPILAPETVICTLPVSIADTATEVTIHTLDALSCYLPVGIDAEKEITYSVRLLYTELEAPVEQDRMVGYVAVMYQGKTVGTLPLYTAETVERSSFIGSIKNAQSLMKSRVFVAGVSFFAIAFTAWMVTEAILLRRKRHKWDKYFSEKMNPAPHSMIDRNPSKRK